MDDLDAELAALEAEVENEQKTENKKIESNKTSSSNNKKINYGNNASQNKQKNPNTQNYEGYGNFASGLEGFLNDNNSHTNHNSNYQNNFKNNYNNYNGNNMNNNHNNPNYHQNNPYNNQSNNSNNYPNYPHASKNPNQYNNYNYNHHVSNQYPHQNRPQTQVRPKNQNQPQPQPKPNQKNIYQNQVISKQNSQNQEPKEDIYPVKQENMYHKLKEMKSLTVLEEEIALCDKIISFKKKRGLEYDDWETKKDLAKMQLDNTKMLIESGDMDFDGYKKIIMGELAYEKKILKFTESDKISKPYELKEIKRRIEQRINVINKELTQNIEEENPETEKTSQRTQKSIHSIKKEELNDSQKKTEINKKISKEIPQDSEPTQQRPSTQVMPNKVNNPNINQNIQTHNKNMNPQIQIPKEYIIQQKVLVTDPKTGKQKYVLKNIIDPKYEKILKQKAMMQNNQNKAGVNPNNQQHQHYIQQKVLVTDPNTGKQKYIIKNILDPKYTAAQNQAKNNQKPPQDNNNLMPKDKPLTSNKEREEILKKQQKEKEEMLKKQQKEKEEMLKKQQKEKEEMLKKQQEEQNKLKEERKKYQLYINTLIKEYTEAKEYFKRNAQEQLANKSRQDLRILMSAKQKVDMGRHKEVKLSSLPKPITPEYIFGYTENERLQKFKLILEQLIKDKNDYDQKMKSIMSKLTKLKRKDLENAKNLVKPKLDELKAKRDNTNKLIEVLKEKFKDKWTPAPEYQKVMESDQVEKVSYEGARFGLKIKVGKTNYDKDKTYLRIALEVNKNKVLRKDVYLKQLGDYNEEWLWDFSGDEFKNIYKNFLFVELYRQHTFSDDKKGQGKVELSNLRKGAAFKPECKIEIESKRVEPLIEFIITPIMPQGKKYYETVQKETIKVTKLYPAFTGKQQIEIPDNKPPQVQNIQQPKTIVNPKIPNLIPKENPQQNDKNPKTVIGNKPQVKIDKNKFKPEELEDVDIIDNLNTLKVLEFKIKELEEKIKKIDGKTPRKILQKKVKMTCKKKQLEEGMGDGTISPKEYLDFLKIQLEHDQLLAMYMKQNNEEAKLKIIMGRIALIKQEKDELEKFIK